MSAYCNIPGVAENPVNEQELDDDSSFFELNLVFIRTSQSRDVLMQKLMREPGIATQAVQTGKNIYLVEFLLIDFSYYSKE